MTYLLDFLFEGGAVSEGFHWPGAVDAASGPAACCGRYREDVVLPESVESTSADFRQRSWQPVEYTENITFLSKRRYSVIWDVNSAQLTSDQVFSLES